MDKVKLLEAIYDRLIEAQILLDEEAFTDQEIDDIYGTIGSAVDAVCELLEKAEA